MEQPFDFRGKAALVTGAASGIGAACARWLAARGTAELVLVDLDGDALDALDVKCETRRFAGDVGDPALWERIEEQLHGLDHAVLNAGIADAAPIAEMDFPAWRRLMAVNLDGMMLSLRCALRVMQPQGSGSVVLTASASALRTEPGTAAYGASKAAVIQMARVAAREAAPFGVRVNAIAPGGVDTPIWDSAPMFGDMVAQAGSREAAIAEMGRAGTPLGRFATPAEIAGQIGFLLSDMAATITGSVLVSDGGYSA
jgi:NAD(P)-dependent dehydrogenase (short-subunit alcohol dehydrogenase family)